MTTFLLFMTMFGAGTQSPPLSDLLARVGRSVELFWQEFPAVTCNERVTQVNMGTQGKILERQDSVFDYLITMNFEADDPAVDESRVLQKRTGKSRNLPLLISNGLPTLLLIFHPYYQGSFEYSLMDEEVVEGKTMTRVHFQHVQGTRSTSALRVRGRDYPLDLQGTAWIEPDSMTVVRIAASLVSPMEDVGLQVLESDVRYQPFQFASAAKPYWLPVTAVIDVRTARQHWRNTHQFTGYKHFSVNTESRVGK